MPEPGKPDDPNIDTSWMTDPIDFPPTDTRWITETVKDAPINTDWHTDQEPDMQKFDPVSPSEARPVIDRLITTQMQDYPAKTQKDIADLLEFQYRNWQWMQDSTFQQDNHVLRINREYKQKKGTLFELTGQQEKTPRRPLTPEEKREYTEMQIYLQRFATSLTNPMRATFFASPMSLEYPDYRPDTRFYISLRDSLESPAFLIALTKELERLQNSRSIPFWEYKIEGRDESDTMRFDPPYRDKGASVILYLHDDSLAPVADVLERFYADSVFRDVFLPQKAPFKFAPHEEEFEPWHIAMERGLTNKGNTTMEMAMVSCIPRFIKQTGLHQKQVSLAELGGKDLQAAWEEAWASESRDPMRPWLTTDRPAPAMLAT